MIKFEKTEVVGWEHAIRGMRNPKNSWDRSDSVIDIAQGETMGELGPNDHKLMMDLAAGGPVHAKYRRMIAVYVDIIAPLYWWKEFDTYKVGTVANSCSTMHKIHDKEFTLDDFSCEHLISAEINNNGDEFFIPSTTFGTYTAKSVLYVTIDGLNHYRNLFLETKDKKYWWQMIQLLPSSYNQKRTVMLNYEVLANIYEWRKNHKLDEWREFCEWIEKLPYSELICGPEFLRKGFNVNKEESEAVKLKEVGESAVEGIIMGLSIESIQERANVRWYDDMMTDTRVVISSGDEPLTGDEKAMLTRMWENQGIRLKIEFREE